MTTEIPAVTEEPFVYVEFDSSNATSGPTIKTYRALIVGQRIAAGTVAELVPTRVRSAQEAAGFFGLGSMLHAMAKAWCANNTSTEAWFVAQDDDGGATAGTQTLTVVGTTTVAGTLYLYIDGELIKVAEGSELPVRMDVGMPSKVIKIADGLRPPSADGNFVRVAAKSFFVVILLWQIL